MAITDINISEQLQTGAPPITYEGNEGPQDPRQEQMVAQLKEEYMKYVFEMQEQGLEPMSFQQFIEQVMAEGQMSSAQPQPQMRQPVAYGGIMGLGGRRQYGLGSSIKKRIRKLIPNEAAKIAEVAAPFVAPFNPAIAGVMSGLGGFDRHGSISKGLKSGLLNYAMGNVAREMGGAGMQKGFHSGTGSGFGSYFTSPTTGSQLWGATKSATDPAMSMGQTVSDKQKIASQLDSLGPVGETMKKAAGDTKTTKGLWNTIKKFGLDNKAILGILGASAAAGLYTAKNPAEESLEDIKRGEGLDIESIRAEVREAFRDPTGKALEEVRIKYPFLGARETKNLDLMAQGGRAGFYEGGLSIPSENTMEDARKTAMQDRLGGITEIMKQADLYRQGDVGQMYMAEGGDTNPWWKFWADDEAAAEELTTQQKNKILKEKRQKELLEEIESQAYGGREGAKEGGLMDLGGMEKDYRNDGGFVPIGGKEKADDVPARLSKNEFVFTADAVRGAGGGDIDKGAEIMENVMKNLEQGGQISEESQGLSGAQEMFDVSERLSEVV